MLAVRSTKCNFKFATINNWQSVKKPPLNPHKTHPFSPWDFVVFRPIAMERQRLPLPYGYYPGCHPRALPVAMHQTDVTTQDKTKIVCWSDVPILCYCIIYYCCLRPLYRILLISLLGYAAISHIIEIPVILCRCIAYYCIFCRCIAYYCYIMPLYRILLIEREE